MARKKKETPAAEPVIEQDPTVETSTAEWKWPESLEKRSVLVEFDDHDRSEIAVQMGECTLERNAVKERKKNSNAAFQAEIDAYDEKLTQFASSLEKNGENREVQCRWVFETAGANDAGELIPDAGHKTLVRVDTGAVVQVARITDEDRQGDLLHGLHDKSEDECLAVLTEYGAAIGEREKPEEGQSAFFLQEADGTETDLVADNRLAALRAALGILNERAANADALLLGIEDDGRSARNDGKEAAENPYEDEDTAEHKAWHQGWLTPRQNGDMFQEEETAVA